MKKIILLGVVLSISIILMSSSASAVEYRTVIEQSNKQTIFQEKTNHIKTISEKLTDMIPTMKIGYKVIQVILIIKFIRLIFSVMKSVGIPVKILILKLVLSYIFNQNTFIRLITTMIRTVGSLFGVILINILKIIRLPFKFISKSITLIIILIRLLVLSSIIRIGINHFPITDITGRFSKIITYT